MSKVKADPAANPLVPVFTKFGLSQTKAIEAVKSSKGAQVLKEIIDASEQLAAGVDEKVATLVTSFASLLSKAPEKVGSDERTYLVEAIISGRLKTQDQLKGMCSVLFIAFSFLGHL